MMHIRKTTMYLYLLDTITIDFKYFIYPPSFKLGYVYLVDEIFCKWVLK